MLATIRSDHAALEEPIATCRFAQRVVMIKTAVRFSPIQSSNVSNLNCATAVLATITADHSVLAGSIATCHDD